MVTSERSDAILYAAYQGDQGNIYPSNKLGGVHRLGKNKLAALLNARRAIVCRVRDGQHDRRSPLSLHTSPD